MSTTDAALLRRLLNTDDHDSWEQFRAIYRPFIFAVCRSLRLEPATAGGLTDAILLKLRTEMPRFRYDPQRGFRKWLNTVVGNEIRLFLRPDASQDGQSPRGGTDHQEALGQLPDPRAPDPNALSESVVEELNKDARLRRLMLFRAALESVKERLREPKRWDAFWAVKAEGHGPKEAAEHLMESHKTLKGKRRPEGWVSVAAADLEAMLKKELENRLNRLLSDACEGRSSQELADYSGRTIRQLREEGVRLAEPLRIELERLLEGLEGVATGGKSATATALGLAMPVGDFSAAADRFGECVQERVHEMEQAEAQCSST